MLAALLSFAVGAAREPGAPCAEAIGELAAYETLLRNEPYFPVTSDPIPQVPMVFSGSDAWEPVYAGARFRIDKLAATAAARSGCEIERLGCFQRFLAAHTAMVTLRNGGGNETLIEPSFVSFREKALRWAMYNLLWLIDMCEAEVQKQEKGNKSSALGPVVYPHGL